MFLRGIYTVYDVGIGKSDKESYKKVARSAGMDISDTWVYEDILRGVRAAHNAGLKCVLYMIKTRQMTGMRYAVLQINV